LAGSVAAARHGRVVAAPPAVFAGLRGELHRVAAMQAPGAVRTTTAVAAVIGGGTVVAFLVAKVRRAVAAPGAQGAVGVAAVVLAILVGAAEVAALAEIQPVVAADRLHGAPKAGHSQPASTRPQSCRQPSLATAAQVLASTQAAPPMTQSSPLVHSPPSSHTSPAFSRPLPHNAWQSWPTSGHPNPASVWHARCNIAATATQALASAHGGPPMTQRLVSVQRPPSSQSSPASSRPLPQFHQHKDPGSDRNNRQRWRCNRRRSRHRRGTAVVTLLIRAGEHAIAAVGRPHAVGAASAVGPIVTRCRTARPAHRRRRHRTSRRGCNRRCSRCRTRCCW